MAGVTLLACPYLARYTGCMPVHNLTYAYIIHTDAAFSVDAPFDLKKCTFQHYHQSVVPNVLAKHHSIVDIQTFVKRCFNAVNKIYIQHHNYNYFVILSFKCNSDVVSDKLFLSNNKYAFSICKSNHFSTFF